MPMSRKESVVVKAKDGRPVEIKDLPGAFFCKRMNCWVWNAHDKNICEVRKVMGWAWSGSSLGGDGRKSANHLFPECKECVAGVAIKKKIPKLNYRGKPPPVDFDAKAIEQGYRSGVEMLLAWILEGWTMGKMAGVLRCSHMVVRDRAIQWGLLDLYKRVRAKK